MHRSPRLCHVIGMGCMLFFAANQAHAADVSPDAFIKQIYKNYVNDGQKPAKGLLLKKKEDYRRYFSTEIADLFYADGADHPGEVGLIDFDPIICAQDWEMRRLPTIHASETEKDRAMATASFANGGAQMEVRYSLKRENAGWRIADIVCPQSRTSLAEALKTGRFSD